MDRMVAYCGITCSGCEAYLATQANDNEALERVAKNWAKEYGAPNMTAEAVTCDGCTTPAGRLSSWPPQCPIRACAVERGVQNCGHCADYACEKLSKLFAEGSEQRQTLDAIRVERGL